MATAPAAWPSRRCASRWREAPRPTRRPSSSAPTARPTAGSTRPAPASPPPTPRWAPPSSRRSSRGKYATIANVGDSRAYLIRANRLNQITQDHSLVAEQVAKGEISADDARTSPHRNRLIHALGQRERLDNRLPGIFEIVLLPQDRLLLCSDGFYDVVPDEDLLRVVLGSSAEVAAATLVDLARQRNTADNVSAVVLAADRQLVETPVPERTTGRTSNAIVTVLVVVGVILFIAIVVAALTLL